MPWKPPPDQAAYTVARATPPRMDLATAAASAGAGSAVTPPPRPPRETRFVDANSELYAIEADDFAAAVLDGKPPAVSESDTLGNMKVLDEIRRQIGLVF
jgi:hypothetical protein